MDFWLDPEILFPFSPMLLLSKTISELGLFESMSLKMKKMGEISAIVGFYSFIFEVRN